MDKKIFDQSKVIKGWKQFSHNEAYLDMMQYIDDMREMYVKYAEERAMPSPNGDGLVPIDNETVAALLQNSRGLNIVKTYIEGRVNTPDVAQSNK